MLLWSWVAYPVLNERSHSHLWFANYCFFSLQNKEEKISFKEKPKNYYRSFLLTFLNKNRPSWYRV